MTTLFFELAFLGGFWAMPRGARRWDSAPWPKIRKRVLMRDGYVGQICGRPGADTVDHITREGKHRI